MRIVSYNLRGGGAGKVHWGKVFDDFGPDVFLVQESYDPIEHLPPLLHGDLHRNACWKCVEGLKWGSAIYVKGNTTRPLALTEVHRLSEQFGKERPSLDTSKRLKREDLELICFEYVSA